MSKFLSPEHNYDTGVPKNIPKNKKIPNMTEELNFFRSKSTLNPNLDIEIQITMENLEMDFHGPPSL